MLSTSESMATSLHTYFILGIKAWQFELKMPHVSVLLLHPGLKSSTFNCLSRSVRTPTAQPVQLKSQPPTARQACQHAAHEKPSASVREACHKGRLLSLHLQIQDGGEHLQRSPLAGPRERCPKRFASQPEQKGDLFSYLGEGKGKKKYPLMLKKNKKEGSKRFISSFAFY